MAFTPEQRSQIIEGYWASGSVRCPEDDSLIDVHRSVHAQGYHLFGQCPRCGQAVKASNEDDPKRADFRKWTHEEVAAMADGYFTSKSATCPVCEVEVDLKATMGPFKLTSLMIHCKRCGHHRTYHPDKPEQN